MPSLLLQKSNDLTACHSFSLPVLGCSHRNQTWSAGEADVAHHYDMVKMNRESLNCLIDATCFLAMHELSFRGHCRNEDSVNKGN